MIFNIFSHPPTWKILKTVHLLIIRAVMKFYRFNIPLLRSEEKPVLLPGSGFLLKKRYETPSYKLKSIKHGSCNKSAITE